MHEVQPRRVNGPPVYRVLGLVVLAVLLVAGGAVVFAGNPLAPAGGVLPAAAADASTAPDATTGPDATAAPGKAPGEKGPGKWFWGGGRGPGGPGGDIGRGFRGGPGLRGPGGFLGEGRGAITIAGIAGTSLALETDDGWTRTIETTGATITKGGQTIALADLKVGDSIRFAQTRNADGSYTVTDIVVVQPKVAGTVTEVSGNTITLSRPDGSTYVVHVGVGTIYTVTGVAQASLSDISVGNLVAAVGTLRDDGSLDATEVYAFTGRFGDHGGRGPRGNDHDSDDPASPDASPDASPNTTTTSG
jgi:hypothetical protein